MTEKVKKLLQFLSEDDAFAKEASEAPTIEEVIALAKGKGIELTDEDIREATRLCGGADDSELEAVAGGGVCACPIGGGGTPGDGNDNVCVCVIIGFGSQKEGDGIFDHNRCICVYAGGGENSDPKD